MKKPTIYNISAVNMTVMDYLAGQALAGVMANADEHLGPREAARQAAKLALYTMEELAYLDEELKARRSNATPLTA